MVFCNQDILKIWKIVWKDLDIAVVGIGDFSNKGKHQWLDMLTEDDFKELTKVKTVGEICCLIFWFKGKEVYENLQERTIAISLEDLKNIPQSLAVAYGDTKVSSILSVLRANLVNHLITDKNTILKVLEEDGDFFFSKYFMWVKMIDWFSLSFLFLIICTFVLK